MNTRKIYHKRAVVGTACALLLAASAGTTVAAPAPQDQVPASTQDWTIKGRLRAGYVHTQFKNLLATKDTYSLGAALQVDTPRWNGLSAGVAGYTAQPLGLNSDDPSRNDVVTPPRNLTVIGKAYLRYQGHGLDVKAGRIALDTPLANSVDRRMIPALYQGVSLVYDTPVDGLAIHANRINRFKPYNTSQFIRGDSGKQPDPWLTNPPARTPSVDSSGFATLGATWHGKQIDTQLWYYHMYDRLNALYGDASWTTSRSFHGWKGVAAFQYAREWNGDDVDIHYRNTDADLYGFKLGASSRYHSFYVVYANNPGHDGAAKGGAFRSPYQHNAYDKSPLFTNFPLFDITSSEIPGHSVGLRYVLHVPKLTMILGLAHMSFYGAMDRSGNRMPSGTGNGRSLVLIYHPSKKFDLVFTGAYNTTATHIPGRFMATRLFLNYHFGN